MTKDSKSSIFCSQEQLEKFKGKVCIWNLTFMDRPLTGKLLEVTDEYFLIEMRDGRTLVARLDCVVGFYYGKVPGRGLVAYLQSCEAYQRSGIGS